MKLSWFHKIVFWVNLIFVVGLIIATYATYFQPSESDFIYLIGLTYPLFLLLNILFILYWVYLLKIHFLVSLVIVLIGYNQINNLIALNVQESETHTTDFSIMSFNVRLLNRYDWLAEENIDQQIFAYIQKESPDIVSFQEFINVKKANLNYIQAMKQLGYPYYKKENGASRRSNMDFFGLITFSKFKIKNSGPVYTYPTSGKTTCIYTDIQIRNAVIRVYNTHLNSMGFAGADYKFVENITQGNEKEAIEKSKHILEKVMVSAIKREKEVDEIKSHIKNSPYPVIVLGDFNEPPYSYAYPQFTETLQDPFIKHSFGVGTTYDGIRTLPGLRLDFILYSPSLISTDFNTGPSGLSDHRPISAGFYISQ